MPDIDGLLALIPVGDIAKKLGISEDVAKDAVGQVVPTLLGGMAANAKDGDGAASLEKALARHSGVFPASAAAGVDTHDGEKIVNNVFGSKKQEVVSAVASTGNSQVTQDIIAKVLPIVAPIVIAWLASQFTGNKSAAPATKPAASGGIGDLLGGLLGGSGGSDVLGNVLGGLLGDGKR